MAVRNISTSSTSDWTDESVLVLPTNYSYVAVAEPPSAAVELSVPDVAASEEDAEDLRDALAAEGRHGARGLEGLSRYSDYRARRTDGI